MSNLKGHKNGVTKKLCINVSVIIKLCKRLSKLSLSTICQEKFDFPKKQRNRINKKIDTVRIRPQNIA